MFPNEICIEYLKSHHFLRNYDVDPFLRRFNYQINLREHICYCVGIIDNVRIVQSICIKNKTPLTGITSYYIEWFHCQNNQESIHFWVHSGVALRKHFFLFQDRMSFIRGTFVYDEEFKKYYRLSMLMPFAFISEMTPPFEFIFATPIKKYHFKKKKNLQPVTANKTKKMLKSQLQRIVRIYNVNNYLEKECPILFHEMKNFIS